MKKINWGDHITNLIVVILGITIAFYLEGWKEENKLSKLEQQYLGSLLTDLDNDKTYLDTLLLINENITHSLEILTAATIGKEYNNDSLANYVYTIGFIPSFQPQVVTYESAKTTGNLGTIKKLEVRKAVIELYEQWYRAAREMDQTMTDHTQTFTQPYFMKNLHFNQNGQLNADFLNDNELRNILFAQKNINQLRSDFYKTLEVELDKVIETVSEELN